MRRQKASTSYQGRWRRQPPTTCRDGQAEPPVSRAKPRSSICVEVEDASRPTTRAKTLVNSPRHSEPYSSAKQSWAVASQSRAVGNRRKAPAYWVARKKFARRQWRGQRDSSRPDDDRRQRRGGSGRRGGGGRRPIGCRAAPVGDGGVGGRRPIGCRAAPVGDGGTGAGPVQAVLLEKLVQGLPGNAHIPGALDEVEQVVATGPGVFQEEPGDGAGEARQELAVRPSRQAAMGRLDDLLGGEALLGGGGGAAEAEQASDLSDLQAGAAVEQQVAEQARGVVVDAATLAKVKGGFEDVTLGGGQAVLGDAGSGEPVGEGGGIHGHRKSSLTGAIPPVYGAARGRLREKAEKPFRASTFGVADSYLAPRMNMSQSSR